MAGGCYSRVCGGTGGDAAAALLGCAHCSERHALGVFRALAGPELIRQSLSYFLLASSRARIVRSLSVWSVSCIQSG